MKDEDAAAAIAAEDKEMRDAVIGKRVMYWPTFMTTAPEQPLFGVVVQGNVDPTDNPMVWVAWFSSGPSEKPEIDLQYVADLKIIESADNPKETMLG